MTLAIACTPSSQSERPSAPLIQPDSLGLFLLADVKRISTPSEARAMLFLTLGTTRDSIGVNWAPSRAIITVRDSTGRVVHDGDFSELWSGDPVGTRLLRRFEGATLAVDLACPAFPRSGPFGLSQPCFGGWALERGHTYTIYTMYKVFSSFTAAGEWHEVIAPPVVFRP
jgi:hypothetical protein